MECCRILTITTSLVLAKYFNLVVEERPGTAAVCKLAASELATMTLVQFLHAFERGVFGFQFHGQRVGQAGCRVLVPLLSGVPRRLDHYGFEYFILRSTFDSTLTYLAYCSSGEVYCSSLEGVPIWFPDAFADRRVHDQV